LFFYKIISFIENLHHLQLHPTTENKLTIIDIRKIKIDNKEFSFAIFFSPQIQPKLTGSKKMFQAQPKARLKFVQWNITLTMYSSDVRVSHS